MTACQRVGRRYRRAPELLHHALVIAVLCVTAFAATILPDDAHAQYIHIGDICRIKGQEENTLLGLGLVVGLNGTGDSETPTLRGLAKTLQLMGNPVKPIASGEWDLDELSNARNVAMVFVTATVPPQGCRQGDEVSCEVNAVTAKSLAGGYLLTTPLLGPRPGSEQVYAFAQGPLTLDQNGHPTSAKIARGCRMEQDFFNKFDKDGKITLVIDEAHASFQTAYILEDTLNSGSVTGFDAVGEEAGGADFAANAEARRPRARALDQVNVEVEIPPSYLDNTVQFVSEVLDIKILPPQHNSKVILDKRNGVIVVGENVLVKRVAVSHKNITVETGNPADDGPLVVLDQDTDKTPLDAVVDALKRLRVDTEDIMSIIENLKEAEALYGQVEER